MNNYDNFKEAKEWVNNNQQLVEGVCPSLLEMPSTACVYGIKVIRISDQLEKWAYIGQSKNFKEYRFFNHAKNICTKYKEEYGIEKEELNIIYKFSIEVLDNYLENKEKREQLENYRIETLKPYTQIANYPKLESKNGYNGKDLCIKYEYRRQALQDAFKS